MPVAVEAAYELPGAAKQNSLNPVQSKRTPILASRHSGAQSGEFLYGIGVLARTAVTVSIRSRTHSSSKAKKMSSLL